MDSELYKRLFRAIFSDDTKSLKQLADLIVKTEKDKGHSKLALNLEEIINQSRNSKSAINYIQNNMSQLPTSKRNNMPLVSYIPQSQLKHHMVLPAEIESRLERIEKEYTAQDRLMKFNLKPKKKVLLYGPPGCGKTLSAERLAWNLGLPLLKVRFDSLLSSFFGESAANLRNVFDYCRKEPAVLLLDECDFIAKSRTSGQDVGEVPRIVNMLLMLLDEYDSPGLVVATTNLKITLDEALFRRFDDVVEVPLPSETEIRMLLKMTLSAIDTSNTLKWDELAKRLEGHSAASIVSLSENAAKNAILLNHCEISMEHFEEAIKAMYIK